MINLKNLKIGTLLSPGFTGKGSVFTLTLPLSYTAENNSSKLFFKTINAVLYEE